MTDIAEPEHDDKDWTWVLEQPCPECRFAASAYDPLRVGDDIRANAESWRLLLQASPTSLREHRRADRWSDLEYAAHVRDVFRLYLERLTLMLNEDDPLYPNWDQNETAVIERYNEQEPAVVAKELVASGDALAHAFDGLTGDQWQRVGRRSDGVSFTVDSFARYLIHDPVHHLWDVQQR